jgi:hypothetical protein
LDSGFGEFSREFSRVVFAVPPVPGIIEPGPNESSEGMSNLASIARTDRSSRDMDGSVCLVDGQFGYEAL